MPHGTPQHNGVSERHNRTLLDIVQSMMSLTDLPLSFWGYALQTAAFTLNRAPSKSVDRSIVPENRVLVILPMRHGSQASTDS